jgi:hypothetical protein
MTDEKTRMAETMLKDGETILPRWGRTMITHIILVT